MAKNLQPLNKYPFWYLQAAEVLTSVSNVRAREAVANAKRAKAQYAEEIGDLANHAWVVNEKTGKPYTYKQWCEQNFMGTKAGWWWYAELNEEDAPAGGPYKTFEQACRAGVRKYGRGKTARHEVTYCLLFEHYYLHDVANLGTDAYAKKRCKYPQAEKLQAQWFELAVNGKWAELKQQWGFAPDKSIAAQVHATVAGRKMFSELQAKQKAREDKIPNEKLKAALTKKGFKYRQHEGKWQWWWADKEWRNYVPGITEREILVHEAEHAKVLGLEDDLWLKHTACKQTGAHYGNI